MATLRRGISRGGGVRRHRFDATVRARARYVAGDALAGLGEKLIGTAQAETQMAHQTWPKSVGGKQGHALFIQQAVAELQRG